MEIKAILFDMDGVLIDSERGWKKVIPEFRSYIGLTYIPPEIEEQTYCISLEQEHSILQQHCHLSISLHDFILAYDKFAAEVYARSSLAKNINDVLTALHQKGIVTSIVTASLNSWLNLFLKRIVNPKFSNCIALAGRIDLNKKPPPDGYLEAMRSLNVTPHDTLVVEDSNRGIQAGKASGTQVIATKEFIDTDYVQTGFDLQINTLQELLDYV